MTSRSLNHGFTLLESLVVLFSVSMLLGLLLPALNAAPQQSRRNQCLGKIKQIGLAMLNYEAANRRFPLVSQLRSSQEKKALTARPGEKTVGANVAGWSWIVRILPYFELDRLYKAIGTNSSLPPHRAWPEGIFTLAPFDPAVVNPDAEHQHASCVALAEMICPSWDGDKNTNDNTTVDIKLATEYAHVAAANPTPPPGSGGIVYTGHVAPTNYKASVGTHMLDGSPVENGAMLLTAMNGSMLASITDGTSKTFLVVETKECGYASWYDGTLNWVVTNDPNAPKPGKDNLPPWTGAQISLNRGYNAAEKKPPYLKKENSNNSPAGDVRWGPSSDHTNGAVMHVFCDCHVEAITDQCDPEVYLSLTTRAGGEAIDPTLIR